MKQSKTTKAKQPKQKKTEPTEKKLFSVPFGTEELTDEQDAKLESVLDKVSERIKKFKYGENNSLFIVMTTSTDNKEDESEMSQEVVRIGSKRGLRHAFGELIQTNPEIRNILLTEILLP
jgi:hypothetical protein